MRRIPLDDTQWIEYHRLCQCSGRDWSACQMLITTAFLVVCGKDRLTGKSYEHRRDWVEEKLLALVKVFCIEVCGYAVMEKLYTCRAVYS